MSTSCSMKMYISKILYRSNKIKSLTALFLKMVPTVDQIMTIMTLKVAIGGEMINETV